MIAAAWVLSHSPYVVGYVQPGGSVLLYDGRICQPRGGRMPPFFHGREGWHLFRPGETTPAVDDVGIPLWLPMVLVITPTAWLWSCDIASWWINRHRIPPGHCRKCGYDLTGNVSRRCPECGAPIRGEGRTA
jgi:hypothetical protein